MNSFRTSLLLLTGLALAACPAPLTPDPLEPSPRIATFTASASQVGFGGQVTLHWETEGATELSLEEVSLGALGTDGMSGSIVVTVTKNSLFVLTARNARGATQRAVVAVSLFEAEGELLLTATPNELDVGQSATLAWSAPGATVVTISSPSGAVELGGQIAAGVVTVSPAKSTTYTLTAGTRTAMVAVTVRPTVISFTSSEDAVDLVDGGASVGLSWNTANAERVRLLTPDRGALVNTTDGGVGSFTDVLAAPIDASRLFRYELEVSGEGRTVTRALVLPVRGHPVINTLTAPRFAREGQPFSVRWTTTGADQLSLFQNGAEIFRANSAAQATAGSVELSANAGIVALEAVASGNHGQSRQSIEVEVVKAPQLALSASSMTIARGAPFTLSWTGQSVRALTLYDHEGRIAFRENNTSDTGTFPLTFTLGASGTYRAVADNGLHELATASLTVNVSNPFSFTSAQTGALRSGQRVDLSWTGGETVFGFAHDDVTLRPGSSGFDDISLTGTPLVFPGGSARDDDTAPIVTTFRAPFYGRIVGDEVSVSTNGYLTFGKANALNTGDVTLPSTRLESFSLAPLWDDLKLFSGSVQWQVKTVGTDDVLIVQWTGATTISPVTSNTFQVKVWSNGQIDFEYQTIASLVGHAGIQGPRGEQGFSTQPASGLGVTFFAPKQSPMPVRAIDRTPLRGFIKVSGALVPVSVSLDVVRPEDLQLSEAMIEPATAVGASGRWFELYNARDTAIDLTGWSFTLPDGGTGALSGTVPAKGVRVFGVSDDPALNDDAHVDVALSGFDVSGTIDSFVWGHDGAFGSWSWNNPTTSVSVVSDFGPYRFSSDTAASLSRAQRCSANAVYGNQPLRQRGTPGTDSACGFGYRWQRTEPAYFDISEVGTKLFGNVSTATQVNVDLSSAPFPWFGGTARGVRVSADGYLTFNLSAASDLFANNFPSTNAPNSVIAVFADDLSGLRADAAIYARRMGANDDPFAAAPHWIIQWSHQSHAAGDDFNFQAKLFDDGVIELHFGQMSGPFASGVSANTWIENPSGTQALVLNASSDTPGISPFTAFRISPRP